MSSAEQDAWVALSEAVREQLNRRVADMGAMKPDELQQFISACQQAQRLGVDTAAHDRQVELELARMPFTD